MKNKNLEIIDLPFNRRMEMATHYEQSHIQPNNSVHVGFLKDGYFQGLYIDLHKQEAKRKNLIEYKGKL